MADVITAKEEYFMITKRIKWIKSYKKDFLKFNFTIGFAIVSRINPFITLKLLFLLLLFYLLGIILGLLIRNNFCLKSNSFKNDFIFHMNCFKTIILIPIIKKVF